MSKAEKLIERLKTYPKDFTWEELVKVLHHFGYTEIKKGKTGGSRRKFANKQNNIISLHKPHPQNVVKEYVIKQIIDHLNL
ncbi:MAG: type II toxin-antitoxin system HicA family toxin [Chitinophagales bacterium]|nr:type II toxin-antitoxin system HicA family toxin [Chitinophagales bacterium]